MGLTKNIAIKIISFFQRWVVRKQLNSKGTDEAFSEKIITYLKSVNCRVRLRVFLNLEKL